MPGAHLSHADLMTLEDYARNRGDFRLRVIEHKKNRRLPLGENATLYFEDRLTMQYQIQEMLRIERIFEPEAIEEELETYNPLIPDGDNLKATFMIEFPEVEERRAQLGRLRGIEACVWMKVEGFERVKPVYNEDLERTDEHKTSAVHFMRFQFSTDMIAALKDGAGLSAGIEHDVYWAECARVPQNIRDSLLADFDAG